MSRVLVPKPLTADAFAPWGEVLEARGAHALINEGRCRRFTDLAQLDIAEGRAGVSLFAAEPRRLPMDLRMVERHPMGSQCFLPMAPGRWLVVVASDEDGQPGTPRAFLAQDTQGVNVARDTWHGVLCPLAGGEDRGARLFAVVDRIGAGANLQEHWFGVPWRVEPG